jgi:hypothetical protein
MFLLHHLPPPPIAWSPAQPKTPPIATNVGPAIKNVPIIYPAKAAETIEIIIILAAVNPKKRYGLGTNAKLIRVAIAPIMVMAPIFLIHHAAKSDHIAKERKMEHTEENGCKN